MQIENVGADTEYYYLPYHSISAEGDKDGISEITYVPSPNADHFETDDKGMLGYSEFAFSTYTVIPEHLIPVLDDVVKKADMINEDRTYHGMLYSCSQLQKYFAENYKYSLQPGRTPMGRDVVEYFLTSQDRGYCMHYASASTLLLRYIGIPARYCEGYVITANQLAEAELLIDENGDRKVKVAISDALAHAWVEVYIPGYGWIPYEMTPPSFGEEDAVPMNGIMGILSGLFSAATREDASGDSDLSEGAQAGASAFRKVFDSIEFLIKPLGFTVAAVILLLLLIPFFKDVIVLFRIARMKKKGNYSDALLIRYRAYVKKLNAKKLIVSVNADSTAVSKDLIRKLEEIAQSGAAKGVGGRISEIASEAERTGLIVRRAAFSERSITEPEYREACTAMKDILRSVSGIKVKTVKSLQIYMETV